MKALIMASLILSMVVASAMITAVYAVDKNNEETSNSVPHKGPAHMEKMHTHMKMMKIQMQAIHDEKDPAKRKQLMQAHRQSMHEGMKMMRRMGGTGRMGMMHGDRQKTKNKDRKINQHARMEHMEHRMDMMHMMMDQMMQHEDAHQHHHHHSSK